MPGQPLEHGVVNEIWLLKIEIVIWFGSTFDWLFFWNFVGALFLDSVVQYLQFNTLSRWVAGTIVSFINRLMFQVLFFFHNFLPNSLQKSFQFIFL